MSIENPFEKPTPPPEEPPKIESAEATKELKWPKIEFPKDIETVRALQNQLAEYEGELDRQMRIYPDKPPEEFTATNYKITILERLLTTGEMDPYKLSKELEEKAKEKDDYSNVLSLHRACIAIEDDRAGRGTDIKYSLEQEKKEGPIIEFPKDIETVRALQNQFVKCEKRLDSEMKKSPDKPPQTFDANYEMAVLKRLLTTGEVNIYELERELCDKYGGFLNGKFFDNACEVVEKFAATGGKTETAKAKRPGGPVPERNLWREKIEPGERGQLQEKGVRAPDGTYYKLQEGERFKINKGKGDDYEAVIVGPDGKERVLRKSLAQEKAEPEQPDKKKPGKFGKFFRR